MEKLSRYTLVFISIFVLSIVVPQLYWTAFEVPVKIPFIQYSCVNHDFLIYRPGEKKWQDTKGHEYTRDEYEQRLPLFFFKQLYTSGTLPDSVNNQPLDMRALSREKSFFRLKAADIDAPKNNLFPLFESRSGRAMLEWPDDFFRITWRIEFIDAATNKILEEKSQMFSAAMFHNGFVFPAKNIWGISSPKKSVDEGYFIVDSKDQLFHLKMVKGKPFVKKVDLPADLKFRYIDCVDFKNRAFYAYLFSEKNEIYILTQDDYKLIKWPVDGISAETSDLKIYGDLFNYAVIMESPGNIKAVVLDKDYQYVDSYAETWPVREDTKVGKVFASVFPAQISLTSEKSKFIGFYFNWSKGYYWLFLNFFLLLLHVAWLHWKKENLKKHIADLAIVAVCGVFGLVAVYLFPNKFSK
jgi:hypothetical protein